MQIEKETRQTIVRLLKETQQVLGNDDELEAVRENFQLDHIEHDFLKVPVKKWRLRDPQPLSLEQLEARRLKEIEE